MSSTDGLALESVLRVCIVDGSPERRAETRRLLEMATEPKHHVTQADTGAAGVRMVLAHPPDCLLLGCDLPDLDAMGVLDALAHSQDLTACPVVVITGVSGATSGRAALEAGAQEYVESESLTPGSLARAIDNARARWARASAATDITERKRIEQELRSSEEFVRLSQEYGRIGTWEWDLTTNRLRWSEMQCRQFGVDVALKDAVPFESWRAAVHPDDLASAEAKIQSVLQAGNESDLEYRIVSPDGIRWMNGRGVVHRDASGNAVRMTGVDIDITERKQAEDAVARLAAIVESSHDGIISADPDGRITSWNHGAASMFGYSAAEMVGHPIFRVIPLARHDAESDVLARVRRDESVRPFETVRLRADGGTVDVSVSVSPIKDVRGTIVGISTVARDISERRRGEDALREHAALFATLIAQAPMGTYVLDAQFRMRQINAEALPAFGAITPLIGRDFQEIVDILWGPEIGAQIAKIFRHTLETGERYISPPFTEWRHDIRMAQSYEWETQRVTLPDGQHGVVCYFHEVTERALATEALRASAQRMSLATEATGVAVWEWHIATNRVRWDAEMFRMYGIAPTPDGDVDYDVWRRADLADNEAILADTVRRCGSSSRTFRIRRESDGVCRCIAAVETVRTNADGSAEWVVGTNLDVTERQRAEEELRRLATELSEADLRKDEFLATLAHELRNPLAPIRNGIEIMRLSNGSGPPFEAALAMIERQSRQMVHLVDDLLDVSRITRGRLELRKERVDLATVLHSAVEASRPLVEAGGHALTLLLPRESVFVDADVTRLAQLFANLLNNAAKYSERGGRIRITAEPQAQKVVVTVEDRGIGIAPEMLPKIFEMFMQVDRSLERSQGGLGIGLGLAKRLAELHGGHMEARSDGLGRGSAFIVSLPIAAPHGLDVVAPVAHARRTATSGRRRILVADDNADAAESLTALLEMLGHEVRAVGDGAAAVAMAESFRPHVIVLDIGMPKLNGYEACRTMRQETWGKGAVVIALSGWGQDEDRRRSQEAGFDHHIAKPVDLTSLERLLDSLSVDG